MESQKKPPTNKNQMLNSTSSSAGTQKNGSSTTPPKPPPPPDNQPPLKCPRCDSPNTKFCYYNNYSLTQPRHFCKTCRRYWTRGGALRNVPIGGGCRKNKKTKSSSSTSFSFSSKPDYASSDTSSDGFKLFYGGFSPSLDQLDQFGRIPFSRLTTSSSINNPNSLFSNHHQQLVSFGDLSASNTSTTSTTATTSIPSGSFHIDAAVSSGGSLMGFSYPAHQHAGSSIFKQEESNNIELFNGGGVEDLGSGGNTNLASSMECLSSINQELHWKLQQQRLAMLFGGGGGDHDENINNNNQNHQIHKEMISSANNSASVSSVSGELLFENLQQASNKPLLPISFQNLEISKQEAAVSDHDHHTRKGAGAICGGNEWFFDNSSYTPIATSTTNNNNSSWKGIQAWSDLQNYSHHHHHHDLQN